MILMPSHNRQKPLKSLHLVSTTISKSQNPGALTEWGEEPSVLAGGVTLLEGLLDGLLGVLTLGNLLESIGRDNALKSLQLESVTGWHQVVVVDDLDEWLDLGALGLAGLAHAAGNLGWVTLDTGDQGVRVWVGLVASILWLNNDNLIVLY